MDKILDAFERIEEYKPVECIHIAENLVGKFDEKISVPIIVDGALTANTLTVYSVKKELAVTLTI